MSNAHLITIIGVKDRVGATPLAARLASKIGREGKSVLLLDADRDYPGDLRRHCGPEAPCQILEAGKPSAELFFPFEWVVADLGSRFHPETAPFLSLSRRLILAMNADAGLVEAMKQKLDFLAQIFFPKKKIGWAALQWDPKSFLTIQAVEEAVGIPCYGTNAEEIFAGIRREERQTPVADAVLHGEEISGMRAALFKAVQQKMEEQGLKNEAQDSSLREKVQRIISGVFEEEVRGLPENWDRAGLAKDFLDDLLGFGPLEKLLASDCDEILVNGMEAIYVEEGGRLRRTDLKFASRESLEKTVERLLLVSGRRVDEASPMADARLEDGSRVNVILPPLALGGPMVSLRRFANKALSPQELVRLGTVNETTLQFLENAVRDKLNLLVSGGTGSGKTTLLNVLSSFIPAEERIITIEDAAELKLAQPHVVRLESRPANIEGNGGIAIRDLVRNALRMRPDRVIVGECRGAEALDMLQAMNTGHDGSLTTLHANSPRDALARLETLVMFAGTPLPSRAVREQIASAIDIIVQVARAANGARRITSVVKVCGLEGDVFTLEQIYE